MSFTYLLHTANDRKKTLYSFMSHVPNDVEKTELSEIEIPTSKEGIRDAYQELLDLLHTSTPDQPQEAPENAPEPPQRDIQLQTKEQFEAAWENFPLSLKLHYAALAVEDGREQIKPR